MIQTTIFDAIYPKFKIDKPIRIITMFSGYDSQALALKYLNVPFEHYKTCEWAVNSIQALKDIHFDSDNTNYSSNHNKDYLIDYLHYKGISSNYNEPMDKSQIKRLSEDKIRTIYNNIQATHNLVNIQKVKAEDLEIKDIDKYIYIYTYSFPCQDLSLAGKRQGMKDNSTRSGMLWEVERILTECENKPQILLMENVPQVHGEGNVDDFNKWQLRLEELGYKNYWEDLIATDYGIPQTRNRCFMVSILGNYSYSFPPKQKLKINLKNMLEDNVDEKYYLSDKMLQYIISKDDKYKVNENKLVINRDIACSKTTREGNTRADTTDYICEELPNNYKLKPVMNLYEMGLKQYNRRTGVVIDTNGSSSTLLARTQGDNNMILIKNATSKGYLEARDGDGVDISARMEYHRGTVQKGKTQTLSTMGGENNGVVVNKINLTTNNKRIKQLLENTNLDKEEKYFDIYNQASLNNISGTLKAGMDHQQGNIIYDTLRVRKLTPKECFRLMGVKDEDFEKCAKNQSNASLYHLAGDSIVVNVLMAIFKEML